MTTLKNAAPTTALARVATSPRFSLAELSDIGKVFAQSGYFKDASDAAKAVTKVIAGQELGIPPMQAMTGIHIVQGKPTLSAALVGALIKRSGRYDYRVKTLTDKTCVLTFLERGEVVGESSFTIAEAQAANLTKNDTWKHYPRNMLLSRALTNGARWYCPDVFGGAIYTPDELDATVVIDGETGEILSAGTPEPVAKIELTETFASEEQHVRLSKLITDLSALDTSRAWTEVAEKYALREFGHGVADLTDLEATTVIGEFTEYFEKIKGENGGDLVEESPFKPPAKALK